MPAYGSGPVQTVSLGALVWNDENVAANACSQAISLPRNPHMPNCISIELSFAANPGAFAIDLQVADTDQDKFYVTKATLNTGLNTAFVGRVEATNIIGKLARLKMVTLTNAVKVTAKIS